LSNRLTRHVNAGDFIGPFPETELYQRCKHDVRREEDTYSCCKSHLLHMVWGE